MKVRSYGSNPAPVSPWATLADAVSRVMKLAGHDAPQQLFERHEDGYVSWVDDGDIDGNDHADACNVVRSKLESGKLEAWGESDSGYVLISSAGWATIADTPLPVSYNTIAPKIAGRYHAVLVKWADVNRLWPLHLASSAKAPRRGRPVEIERGWVEEKAKAAIEAMPDISRASLAASLIEEYRSIIGRETDQRGMERILKEMSLPPGD